MSSVSAWHLKETTIEPISMEDQNSLDSITSKLPEGYYSTFRTFGGGRRVLGLDAHLRRLYGPVSAPEVDAVSLRRQLRTLLQPDRPGELRVRLVMTKQGEVYIAMEPLKTLPREVYENGVRVETTELHRQHPQLKSTAFIVRSDSKRKHIAQGGLFEALLVKNGKILEGMTSNFFYVSRAQRDEILCTAGDDILLGITRDTVIDIARGRGLEVMYESLHRDHLSSVVEAFITSSSRGIVPVIQIDDTTVGQGRPGPITRELMDAYESYVIEHSEEI